MLESYKVKMIEDFIAKDIVVSQSDPSTPVSNPKPDKVFKKDEVLDVVDIAFQGLFTNCGYYIPEEYWIVLNNENSQ